MKVLYILFAGLIALGCDSQTKSSSSTVADKENEKKFDTHKEKKEADFVADAIQDRYAEIKFAELVSTKSSNKDIQDFAQELVNDQSKILAELQRLANERGVTVPVDEGDATKEKINKLFKQDDPDFDKKWCSELSKAHKKSIRECERMFDKTDDADLKNVVNQALITLRASLGKLEHLEKQKL